MSTLDPAWCARDLPPAPPLGRLCTHPGCFLRAAFVLRPYGSGPDGIERFACCADMGRVADGLLRDAGCAVVVQMVQP